MDRRNFLRMAAGGLLAACTEPLFAGTRQDFWNKPRSLWMRREVRKGVWEEVNEVYFANGKLVEPGYVRLCRLMRDVNAGKAVQMSPVLMDIMYGMQGFFQLNGQDRVIVLTSGYRTVFTNEAVGGKAASRHLYGAAGDLFIPGVSVAYTAKLAQYLQGGGVGFYPHKGIVHVDDGDLKVWRG